MASPADLAVLPEIVDIARASRYFLARGAAVESGGPVPYRLRSPAQIAAFFDGMELIEPGVVSCPRWRPELRVSFTNDARPPPVR